MEFSDVNGDGKDDLLLVFDSAGLKVGSDTRKATLSGWLRNSQAFTGETPATVVP